jgi:hypothetical protein
MHDPLHWSLPSRTVLQPLVYLCVPDTQMHERWKRNKLWNSSLFKFFSSHVAMNPALEIIFVCLHPWKVLHRSYRSVEQFFISWSLNSWRCHIMICRTVFLNLFHRLNYKLKHDVSEVVRYFRLHISRQRKKALSAGSLFGLVSGRDSYGIQHQTNSTHRLLATLWSIWHWFKLPS